MKGSRSVIKEKIIPLASHLLLTVVNLYCLTIYYTNVMDRTLVDLGYVAYTTMLANGLIGLTKIISEESFMDLRILLDYAQVVLPHPFLMTVLWDKHNVGPYETALPHCVFGLVAFLFFVLMEYKRQDLSDLALIFSIISSISVGILYKNYFSVGAGTLLAVAYFSLKRGEECVLESTQPCSSLFNFAMAAYALITLGQFEPKSWIPRLGAD